MATQLSVSSMMIDQSGHINLPGSPPPGPPPWSLSLEDKKGAKRGRREEGRGRRFGIVSPGSPKGCPHLAHGAS